MRYLLVVYQRLTIPLIDNAKDLDIVMSMHNLIEYSKNYSKTSGSLWNYYRDEPNDLIADSKFFKFKTSITGSQPNNNDKKEFKNAVPLKYLSNFWITFKKPLINGEISLNLTLSKDCVITDMTIWNAAPARGDNPAIPAINDLTDATHAVTHKTHKTQNKMLQQSKLVLNELLTGINIDLK